MEENLTVNCKKRFNYLGLVMVGLTVLGVGLQLWVITFTRRVRPALYENGDTALLYSMMPLFLVELLTVIIGMKLIKEKPLEKKKMGVGNWFLALVISIAGMYISNIVGLIITAIIGVVKGGQVGNPMVDLSMGTSVGVAIFIFVIAAPILEELIFRKFLIDRMSPFGEKTAVFVSALMFGLFHGNLNQFVYAFTLGLVWGYVYAKTRNVIYNIALHMSVNMLSSVIAPNALKLANTEELVRAMAQSQEAYLAAFMDNIAGFAIFMIYVFLLLAAVITGIVLFFVKKKSFVFEKKESDIPKGSVFKTVFVNPGMVLFCLLWLGFIIRQLIF